MTLPKDIISDNFCLGHQSILLAYRGSIAHGMYTPPSDPNSIDDKDVMGVCVPPVDWYFGIHAAFPANQAFPTNGTKEIKRDEWDIVVYEARKFIQLLVQGNPNVLMLLWLEKNYYLRVTEAGQMILDKRDIFVGRHVYKAFTGYAYGQLHRMTHAAFEGHMGTKRKTLVEKYGYDCYDAATTEFLTDSGWKYFDDVLDHQLGTIDINTGTLKLCKPIDKIDKKYTGKMYILEPHSSRAIVTANHKLLVSPAHRSAKNLFSNKYDSSKANWELLSVNNIIAGNRSIYHIRRAPEPQTIDYPTAPSYLQLAGLYISEGTTNYYKGNVKSIRFTQKKIGIFHILADQLMNVYPIRKYVYPKETIWVLHGKIARSINDDFGHSSEKHLPLWCYKLSINQVNLFWECLMAGDGTRKKSGDIYYTSSPMLASDIQAMLIFAGIPCTIYGPYIGETQFGKSVMFHIWRSKKSNAYHALNFNRLLRAGQSIENKKDGYPVKEIEVKDKRVVCFEVSTGTLITRNCGKIAIYGNCKNAAHLIRLLRMGAEFLKDGQLNVLREDACQLLEIKRGEWTLEQVKTEADRGFAMAELAYQNSTLPKGPDLQKANDLAVAVIETGLYP
jgi:hypothetical protein